MKMNNLNKPMAQLALPAALLGIALTTTGCGGSSSSNDTNGETPEASDGVPTTTSLSGLSGLSTHAGQNHPLLYVDASRSNGLTGPFLAAKPWLMAYDPQSDSFTELDKNLSGRPTTINSILPQPLHSAELDSDTGEVTNYRIDSLVYLREEKDLSSYQDTYCSSELMRADLSNLTTEQVTDQTGCSADVGDGGVRQLVAFNPGDPEQSWYAFVSNGGSQYKMTQLDADDNTAPRAFATSFTVQSPLSYTHGQQAGTPYGWLVTDDSQGDCMALVKDADLTDAECIPNADGSGNVALTDKITGVYHLTNGDILSLPYSGQSSQLQTTSTLWFYERGSGNGPGELHLLKSDNGKKLHTKALPFSGTDEAGRVLIKNDGKTLYMAIDDGGFAGLLAGPDGPPSQEDILDMEFHVNLLRINTENGNIGWEQIYTQGGKLGTGKTARLGNFLADAGDRVLLEINRDLISLDLDGNNKKALDERENHYGGVGKPALGTPSGVVSSNDWFFYNRKLKETKADPTVLDYATAIKVDGSERVEVEGCRWIGVSTTGQTNHAGNSFASLQPGEVFMACNNKALAAVDANDPTKGKVSLGSLDQKAENIEMRRAGLGPHRLIRVTYDDGNDKSYEVVYVNVSSSNSLKHLMDSPADEKDVHSWAGFTTPVNGF